MTERKYEHQPIPQRARIIKRIRTNMIDGTQDPTIKDLADLLRAENADITASEQTISREIFLQKKQRLSRLISYVSDIITPQETHIDQTEKEARKQALQAYVQENKEAVDKQQMIQVEDQELAQIAHNWNIFDKLEKRIEHAYTPYKRPFDIQIPTVNPEAKSCALTLSALSTDLSQPLTFADMVGLVSEEQEATQKQQNLFKAHPNYVRDSGVFRFADTYFGSHPDQQQIEVSIANHGHEFNYSVEKRPGTLSFIVDKKSLPTIRRKIEGLQPKLNQLQMIQQINKNMINNRPISDSERALVANYIEEKREIWSKHTDDAVTSSANIHTLTTLLEQIDEYKKPLMVQPIEDTDNPVSDTFFSPRADKALQDLYDSFVRNYGATTGYMTQHELVNRIKLFITKDTIIHLLQSQVRDHDEAHQRRKQKDPVFAQLTDALTLARNYFERTPTEENAVISVIKNQDSTLSIHKGSAEDSADAVFQGTQAQLKRTERAASQANYRKELASNLIELLNKPTLTNSSVRNHLAKYLEIEQRRLRNKYAAVIEDSIEDNTAKETLFAINAISAIIQKTEELP